MKLVLIFAVLAATLVASEAASSKYECTASGGTSTVYWDNDCKRPLRDGKLTFKSGECNPEWNSKITCESGGKIKLEQFKIERTATGRFKNEDCKGEVVDFGEFVNSSGEFSRVTAKASLQTLTCDYCLFWDHFCMQMLQPMQPNNSAGIAPTMVLALAASLLGCSLAYL